MGTESIMEEKRGKVSLILIRFLSPPKNNEPWAPIPEGSHCAFLKINKS